jgi:hypothetical protein
MKSITCGKRLPNKFNAIKNVISGEFGEFLSLMCRMILYEELYVNTIIYIISRNLFKNFIIILTLLK